MATPNGQSTFDLKNDLLGHGHQFTFFQAIRLLTRLTAQVPERGLRIRPELSLGFPACDVAQIEERPGNRGFSMTATFFGLYGVSSPLPAFYTEDLFRDRRDDSGVTRDFLDILHHRLFVLLFESWKKYRLFIQVAEAKNPVYLDMLYAISGLSGSRMNEADAAEDFSLIRYASLLGARPRSALGLETMLIDFLGGDAVEIVPFVPRAVKIPRDQQLRLGSDQIILGQNSLVGEEFLDRQGKFRVRIGPLSRRRFRPLLQEGDEHRRMVKLIARYLTDPLDYDIELILEGKEIRPTCLSGPEWPRLGLDTALFTGDFPGNLSVVFPPVAIDRRIAA